MERGPRVFTVCWTVLLLSLPTCSSEEPGPIPRETALTPRILKAAPATEVATWQLVIPKPAPEGRYLQAVTFDENRGVLLMFGGRNEELEGQSIRLQDMWEWSPATGAWTPRQGPGVAPEASEGAAMVFDPVRNKVLLFGGYTEKGDSQDLWEWDPTTGAWSKRSETGKRPPARAQHAMVYEKSTDKILLFGGASGTLYTSSGVRSDTSVSLGDTWELDPASGEWTLFTPPASPSVRHHSGLVWDSTRNKAVLFGGTQVSADVARQDLWEWDPLARTWTERAPTGNKPSQRSAHAMAYDRTRGKVVVFGGMDVEAWYARNDMWEWDPSTGEWTQTRDDSEQGLPSRRSFSSMAYDGTRARLILVAGGRVETTGRYITYPALNEVWEIDPATLGFTDRSVAYQGPVGRSGHAMAYDPTSGKVYAYAGAAPTTSYAYWKDLWGWDGTHWNKIDTKEVPPGRTDMAMAHDPVRRSLILFGGRIAMGGKTPNETWEWSVSTREWTKLTTNGSPTERYGHAMVTDTVRKKVLLFGGAGFSSKVGGEIWEWDGATLTWSRRDAAFSAKAPAPCPRPVMSFDDTRGKLLLFKCGKATSSDTESIRTYWEWDVLTEGWALHDRSEPLPTAESAYAAYDPIRLRHILYAHPGSSGYPQTWELDAGNETWYTRALDVKPDSQSGSMVFDSARGIAVLFSGRDHQVWEYSVNSLTPGEGCTAETASACASGQCVDGVCCETASCTGACMACNVRGSEGKCALAQAGTEVPRSCSQGQACDGTGACKSKNGQACTAATACASGFCVDGVCCDSACEGACKACNLTGREGTCTPEVAGSDPKEECGPGTDPCRSVCDGVGACALPLGLSCGPCLTCDGAGTCTRADTSCGGSGGSSSKGSLSTALGSGGVGGSGGSSSKGSLSTALGSGGVGDSGGVRGRSDSGRDGTGGSATSGSVSSAASSGGREGGANGGRSLLQSASGGGSGGVSAIAPDGGLVGRLSNRGCSCELGQVPAKNAFSFWMFLGATLLAWGTRRRRRGCDASSTPPRKVQDDQPPVTTNRGSSKET